MSKIPNIQTQPTTVASIEALTISALKIRDKQQSVNVEATSADMFILNDTQIKSKLKDFLVSYVSANKVEVDIEDVNFSKNMTNNHIICYIPKW